MQISGKFDQDAIKYFKDAKNLHYLHGWHNRVFALPKEIKTSIEPSKMLNAKLIDKDIFSFSFVRHPYTRYTSIYLYEAIFLKNIILVA